MSNQNFFERVYEVARIIPHGRVTSYGAIAKYLGTARSARMVGWAMNRCHTLSFYVPAHRVVNKNGLLTGKFHFGNTTTMRQLLENEGALIENDRITNFSQLFWDPSIEID